MSVVLEKDKIIISIHSGSPDEELEKIRTDLMQVLGSAHKDTIPDNFYFIFMLLEAMVPSKQTYQSNK